MSHDTARTKPAGRTKRECLKRAQELLASERPANLAYAALELRMCLEAMTYEKLRSYEKQLPPSFLRRTWQPPQLLKAMKQFDSGADHHVQIFVGLETVPGVPADPAAMQYIGEHKAFGLDWLRKNYNKLGAMLHVHRKGRPIDESALRRDLTAIANEIADAQTGTILGAWLGEVVTFDCQLCREQVMASINFIATERRAVCTNESCEAEYDAEIVEGGGRFMLRAVEMCCPTCNGQLLVQKRHLGDGQPIICPGCEGRLVLRADWRLEPGANDR